jgi:HEAT repeat protein
VTKNRNRAVRTSHAGRRAVAAHSLARGKDATAVESLVALLDDDDAGVLVSAQVALAEIGEPSVAPLVSLLYSRVERFAPLAR